MFKTRIGIAVHSIQSNKFQRQKQKETLKIILQCLMNDNLKACGKENISQQHWFLSFKMRLLQNFNSSTTRNMSRYFCSFLTLHIHVFVQRSSNTTILLMLVYTKITIRLWKKEYRKIWNQINTKTEKSYTIWNGHKCVRLWLWLWLCLVVVVVYFFSSSLLFSKRIRKYF